MNITYNEGSIDDIEAVFRLNRLVFDESWSKDVMLQSLQVGYDLYVCYGDNGLIAYVLSQDILYETQIMQLAVLPTYRRMGIAKHLMQLLMKEKSDMDMLMLEVRLSIVPAQHFYQHMGFEKAGQRPNYYSKTKTMPREDALLLQLRR